MDISVAGLGKFVLALAVWAAFTLFLPWAILTEIASRSENEFVSTLLRDGITFQMVFMGMLLVVGCLEIDSEAPQRKLRGWFAGALIGFAGVLVGQGVAALFHPRAVGSHYWARAMIIGVFSGAACAIITAVNDKWKKSDTSLS